MEVQCASVDMASPSETCATSQWRAVTRQAVALYGTPCYVTRLRPVTNALHQLEHGHGHAVRCWLSFKTHPLPPLVKWWTRTGRGVEVVSEAEFVAARRLGASVDQLLVNGVGKHGWLNRQRVPRLRVHFDSLGEIEALLPLAEQLQWRVGVRVQAPDERDARDERFAGQFGMTTDEAILSFRRLIDAGCSVESVHFHLGQRLQDADAYVRAVEHVAGVCEAAAFRPRFVDCGGGLPAPSSASAALAGLRDAVRHAYVRFGPELEEVWLENGRYVTEQSASLAIRVLDVKDRDECRYLICDGGRTNHALAADVGLHPIVLLQPRSGAPRLTTICGPTCMTDDTLGRIDLPDDVAPGDVLLWLNAGAYHLPWETRFSHGLCAVAWCNEAEELSLARERERPDEWIQPWNLWSL